MLQDGSKQKISIWKYTFDIQVKLALLELVKLLLHYSTKVVSRFRTLEYT